MHQLPNDLAPFPIRPYRKAELAMLYCSAECVTNAMNTLSRWIRHNAPLREELQAVGYNKYRQCYTPREVKIIVKYLGEPGG